jgi:hypothetical protein
VPCLHIFTVLAGATLGGYLTNYKRHGANQWIAHAYVNTRYLLAKGNFTKNFEVLNRQFTQDEIKQFNHNADLQRLGKKKYVYNSRLHSSEDEYKEEYERINSGNYILSEKSKEEIAAKSASKSNVGENTVIKPYNEKILDFSERNLGIINNNFLAKNHHLD